jgi:putative membrane protein
MFVCATFMEQPILKRFFSWLAMLIVGIVVVFFSISNRVLVTLDFWPLPFSQEAPIYFSVLIAGFLGFIFGGAIAWFSAGGTRKKARQANRRASSLSKDLSVLQSKIDELDRKRKHIT